jgi:predicted nucleic acid-binding protein
MALAKIGGLDALFRLFPKILTPPAVYQEVITEGLRLGAPDAAILEARYRAGELNIASPTNATLPRPSLLGRGEEQSILLAIERQAAWLLADDLSARRAAQANLEAAGVETNLKGTLGIILAACQDGHLLREEAVRLIEAIRRRQDIWISNQLCDRALDLLQ